MVENFHFPVGDDIISKYWSIHGWSEQTSEIIWYKDWSDLLGMIFHFIVKVEAMIIYYPPYNYMSTYISSYEEIIFQIWTYAADSIWMCSVSLRNYIIINIYE